MAAGTFEQAGTIPTPATGAPKKMTYAPAAANPTFWQRVRDLPWSWAGVTLLVMYCLFPFRWLVRLSMDPSASGSLLPSSINFKHYASAHNRARVQTCYIPPFSSSDRAAVGGLYGLRKY